MKSSISIIFLSLILFSCGRQNYWQNFLQRNSEPQIRIVDMDGKAHPIVTRVPELNAQAMDLQGRVLTQKSETQQGEVKYQNYQDQNLANARATNTFPQSNQLPQPQAKDEMLGVTTKETAQVVEYNLSESKDEVRAEKIEQKSKGKKTIKAESGDKFFVQVGSFINYSSAESLLKKIKKFHAGKVQTVEGERTTHRVLIGPFSSKAEAREVKSKIIKSGQEAILIKGE